VAHVAAPKPSNPALPIFFNVDGVVGAQPAANKREDVLLVQFLFRAIASSSKPFKSPATQAAASAVQMTGIIDPKTINAIRVMQQNSGDPGKVADGRVSPAQSGYSYGGATWSITDLNITLRDRFREHWPRIDKIPLCPDELKQMVIRTLVGV
jgi:hypothetical protein